MAERIAELRVSLGEQSVGSLHYENEAVAFRLDGDYINDPHRDVLGQLFEDDLEKVHRVRSSVPRWFANLLPEGPLRDFVASAAGVHPARDFFLLGHLGADLPGNVRLAATDDTDLLIAASDASEETDEDARELHETDFEFKFSLAGVQLKFSVLSTERGVTIPLTGAHGDRIVKLPDSRHDGVPENEFSMMTWARSVGIAVPQFELIDTTSVRGIPAELAEIGQRSFLIRRFDRAPDRRIHIEDFAQVLDRSPSPAGKYGGANYETIARVLLALAGLDDVKEFVRRLVINIAMGNGDAHLKNWSLMYEDGRSARLSPAYDLVSTFVYVRTEETLALNLAGSKSFTDITAESFRRLARKIGLESDRVLDDAVQESVQLLQTSWQDLRNELPATVVVKEGIDERLKTLPLLQL